MNLPPATGKRVAIAQSNYIPWKGYFDLINTVDECILYDDAQYTTRDWRNRNRIKTFDGARWLTIPVRTAGRRTQRIRDAVISDADWARRHWLAIQRNYTRAPWFNEYAPTLRDVYETRFTRLTDVNRRFIEVLCGLLGIRTTITCSSDYALVEGTTDRLISLCGQSGAAEYVSGPSARVYLDEQRFAAAGITVRYVDYAGYEEYPQLHGPFDHAVSVVDLLFNVGPEAARFLKTTGVRV